MVDGFLATLPKLAIALMVFGVFWLVARTVRGLVRRSTADREYANVGRVLGRLAYWLVLLTGLLVAVTVVAPSMTPARLVSVLGIGGVAIGFAFQDIFSNLLAGILLLLREPFRVGDEIISGDYQGVVEGIETRATFIRTYDGRRIIIPNNNIYTDPVTVITAYGG